MTNADQIALLAQRYCPYCKYEDGEPVILADQTEQSLEIDGAWARYWYCPECGKWEVDIAEEIGVGLDLCKHCSGYGTTGYGEWEENCDQCAGIGYTLEEVK